MASTAAHLACSLHAEDCRWLEVAGRKLPRSDSIALFWWLRLIIRILQRQQSAYLKVGVV